MADEQNTPSPVVPGYVGTITIDNDTISDTDAERLNAIGATPIIVGTFTGEWDTDPEDTH